MAWPRQPDADRPDPAYLGGALASGSRCAGRHLFLPRLLVPVLAALVIGFASWPVYTRLLRLVGGNTTLGATIAIVLIIAFLVVPIFIAASYTASEIREWFGWAVHVNKTGAPVPDWIAALPAIGPWLANSG